MIYLFYLLGYLLIGSIFIGAVARVETTKFDLSMASVGTIFWPLIVTVCVYVKIIEVISGKSLTSSQKHPTVNSVSVNNKLIKGEK